MNTPSPQLPPLPRDQRKIDADHLNLLAIFHFVGAGLAVLGLLFLLVHYTFMHAMFTNPKFFENQKQPMPMTPEQLFAIFKWFYLAFQTGHGTGKRYLDELGGISNYGDFTGTPLTPEQIQEAVRRAGELQKYPVRAN